MGHIVSKNTHQIIHFYLPTVCFYLYVSKTLQNYQYFYLLTVCFYLYVSIVSKFRIAILLTLLMISVSRKYSFLVCIKKLTARLCNRSVSIIVSCNLSTLYEVTIGLLGSMEVRVLQVAGSRVCSSSL